MGTILGDDCHRAAACGLQAEMAAVDGSGAAAAAILERATT
jgi:hypothetical protein